MTNASFIKSSKNRTGYPLKAKVTAGVGLPNIKRCMMIFYPKYILF